MNNVIIETNSYDENKVRFHAYIITADKLESDSDVTQWLVAFERYQKFQGTTHEGYALWTTKRLLRRIADIRARYEWDWNVMSEDGVYIGFDIERR